MGDTVELGVAALLAEPDIDVDGDTEPDAAADGDSVVETDAV